MVWIAQVAVLGVFRPQLSTSEYLIDAHGNY